MKRDNLIVLIDLALAVVKDIAIEKSLVRVKEAHREYLLAEASSNRDKSKAVVRAIAKIDTQCIILERDYLKAKDTMVADGRAAMEPLLDMLKRERMRLVEEKNRIMDK